MELVIRASLMFLVIFGITRGLRRRTLSEMNPFEMILLVILGDIVQQGITQEDTSISGAVLVVATFAFWISLWSWLSYRSDRARRLIEGVPVVVVADGKVIDDAVRLEQIPMEDLLEAARQEGLERLDQVRLAVLEPSGRLSFIRAPSGETGAVDGDPHRG